MLRAAAFLGVAGAFRPGELFGSGRERERALRREQVSFFSDSAGTVPLLSPDGGVSPRVLQVTLRLTKTSQMAPVVKLITAPDSVLAVWNWYCQTAERSPRDFLFQLAVGERPLSTYALSGDLSRRYALAGLGKFTYYGKSLRQGGASSLAVQGYSPGDIAALGWAPNSSMWEIYARDPAVQRQRALSRGSLMQPSLSPPVLLRSDSPRR